MLALVVRLSKMQCQWCFACRLSGLHVGGQEDLSYYVIYQEWQIIAGTFIFRVNINASISMTIKRFV